MLGNDLVDLGDPETRPSVLHPRFDERVFTPAERESLWCVADPHRLRWTLWAAKEAAFKWLRKQDARAIFSPSRLRVDLDSLRVGTVWVDSLALPFSAEQAEEFVHVVVRSPGCARAAVATGAEGICGMRSASEVVRELAKTWVACGLGLSASKLHFLRGCKIPRLLSASGIVDVDLSLSHHGRFVAFAGLWLREHRCFWGVSE